MNYRSTEFIFSIVSTFRHSADHCDTIISDGNAEFLSDTLNFYRIVISASIDPIFSIASSVRYSADSCDTNEADDKM